MQRALQDEGLVKVVTSATDGRFRVARLTVAGLRERGELDAASDNAAAAVLSPLSASQRDRLVTAMAEADRLLQASLIDVSPEDPHHPDAQQSIAALLKATGCLRLG